MEVIDKILREWSFRCHDGIVDMNDPKKVAVLNEILDEYDLQITENKEIEYTKTLNRKEISKDRGGRYRGDIVVDFVNNKLPFTLKDGSEQILDFAPGIKDIFLNHSYNDLKPKQEVFIDPEDENRKYKLEDIVKTDAFGGRIKGFFIKHETFALNALDQLIKNIKSEKNIEFINVKIGNNIYNNISKAENQPSNLKSDFNLINSEGVPVVFISHKAGGGARTFARWGGFQFAIEEPDVKNFISNISSKLINNEFKRKESFAQKINSLALKNRIVFGKDLGGKFGPNNVQIVIQGKITLTPLEEKNNTYVLGGDMFWLGGDNPTTPTGDYEPVLEAHYRSDQNALGFKYCEAFAKTIAVIPQKTVKFNW
jgi:hypothetical protein